MSCQEKTDPVLEPDLGFGEHHTGLESPRLVDVDTVVGDSIVGGYEALRSAHGDSLRIANNPGDEADDPNPETSCEAMASSVPHEERGQGGKANLSETGGTGANWKDGTRIEYVSHGNGLSSPSVQETQDGETKKSEDGGLLSQHEASAQSAALTGLETWVDIEDPTRSEYILFHEPVGGSVAFRERNYVNGSLSFKSVSLDGSDVSELPSLRRRAARKPPPFRETDRKRLPSQQKRGLKGNSQRRPIIELDYAAGSLSSGAMKGTSRYNPALPRSKSEPPDSTGNNKPSLLTGRDGCDELQEGDIASKLLDHYWHDHHHCNWHEHSLSSSPVVQHDVVRLLTKQTKYNLICPICGSLITRQLILRKKKRRFVREKRARFRKSFEIIPVAIDDDENQISGSGTSSDHDIQDEKWNGGFVACFRYFFCG